MLATGCRSSSFFVCCVGRNALWPLCLSAALPPQPPSPPAACPLAPQPLAFLHPGPLPWPESKLNQNCQNAPAIDHAHQHPSAPASPPSIEMHCVYQPATFPPHSPSHRTSWSTCRVHNRSSSGSIRQHSAALHASNDTLSACPPILTLHARLTPSPWVVPRPGVPRGVQRSRQVRRWPARVSRRPAAAVPTCCGVAERRWGCQRRLRVREAGRGAPAAALALRVSTQ